MVGLDFGLQETADDVGVAAFRRTDERRAVIAVQGATSAPSPRISSSKSR